MKRAIKNFYKISIHTERGKALSEFMRQCREAEKAADEWAQNHHAAEYIEPVHAFAGGVVAVAFDGYTPDLSVWRKIETPEGDTYVPNVPDDFDVQEARQRQQNGGTLTAAEQLELSRMSLPIMSVGHFFDVLPYASDVAQRININSSPMLFQRNSFWYVASPVLLKHNDDVDTISQKTFFRNRLSKITES